MTAFLFDESHPDLDAIYGPQCASFIIAAVQSTPHVRPIRLLRGSLLHSRYCYELAEVTLSTSRPNTKGPHLSSSGQLLRPNMSHFTTVICDLAETMKASGSSMSEEDLQVALAQKKIWAVVCQGLPNMLLNKIEEALEGFGPYMGWVKVDWSNPVHMDIFANTLFKDMFVDEHELYKRCECQEDIDDYMQDCSILKEYGAKSAPKLLIYEKFEEIAPKLIEASEPTDRGKVTARRAFGESLSHRMKIGRALSQENHQAVGSFKKFSTSRPEDGVEFVVPEDKLTKYLLNLDHPKGGPKAKFFRDSLSIVANDWRYLADQFCQAARNSDFYRLDVKEYGIMHGAYILVTGRNGRKAVVETGWKFEEFGPGRFVTAYPGDESKIATLEPVVGRVPESNCTLPERWETIHEMAHNCGLQRAEAKEPVPMVLKEWGTIWEGLCGFGWVFLPDARVPFARWLLKENIGYASRPGVHIFSRASTQSIEKNLAYAEGYAEVLKANGITCRAESRLD